MKLKINRIVLDNFRGATHKEIEFDGNMVIKGQNGSGKSTVFSAVTWLFTDTDSNLVKNPNVVPIGTPECLITVRVDATIDDKPVSFKKMQKYRERVDEWGKKTSSVTNNYAINDVEKSYTNFYKEVTERGLDIEKYLILSHPNAFLADTSAKGREKIREILFSMAGEVSDETVATRIGADEIADLLNIYSLDEIKAKQKSTIKQIIDCNGKNNEIINSKIDGMLSSKTEVDVDVLEEQKSNYESEISRIDSELSNISNSKVDIQKRISELQIKLEQIKNNSNLQLNKDRNELEKKIREFSSIISDLSFNLERSEKDKAKTERCIEESKAALAKERTRYKMEQDAVIDEGDLSCPVCHRTYEEDKLQQIKADFEKNKAEKLQSIQKTGETLKAQISSYEEEVDTIRNKIETLKKTIEETQKMLDDAQGKLSDLPTSIDMSSNEEFQSVSKEIESLESELSKSDDSRKEELESQRNLNREMLNQVVGELGKAERNKEIDARVEELREQRSIGEVNKAKAERLLKLVNQVEKEKNQTFANNINKHFDLVEWHLWDVRKNGEYVEVTEPYIDGKPMSSCANGSLVTLAKISICESLQRFTGQYVPLWCDDYSLFSDNSRSRLKIDSNTQFIGLLVTEDKEIKVEKEN